MRSVDCNNFFVYTRTSFAQIATAKEVCSIIENKPDFISYEKIRQPFPDDEYENEGWNRIVGECKNLIAVVDDNDNRWSVVKKINDEDFRYLIEFQTETVSSLYWYLDDGVYRLSDHWGKTATCLWTFFDTIESRYQNLQNTKHGFRHGSEQRISLEKQSSDLFTEKILIGAALKKYVEENNLFQQYSLYKLGFSSWDKFQIVGS
jgi:hypothetical protein